MAKKIEFKPNCVPVSAHTWETLRNHYGVENIVGYLILKININRVTYSTHKVNGMNTLDENGEIVNVCIGTQIADTITLKCDDDAISFFVDNRGKFLFWINHEKGIIYNNSVGFKELDWADENGHLQSFLNDLGSD